jgi:hypothetical protein
LVSQVIQAGGPGAILIIFKKLPEDMTFGLINLFSPLWHSSLLYLQSSEFFKTYAFAGPLSIFSIILTVAIIIMLANFSVETKHQKNLFSLFNNRFAPLPFWILCTVTENRLGQRRRKVQHGSTNHSFSRSVRRN